MPIPPGWIVKPETRPWGGAHSRHACQLFRGLHRSVGRAAMGGTGAGAAAGRRRATGLRRVRSPADHRGGERRQRPDRRRGVPRRPHRPHPARPAAPGARGACGHAAVSDGLVADRDAGRVPQAVPAGQPPLRPLAGAVVPPAHQPRAPDRQRWQDARGHAGRMVLSHDYPNWRYTHISDDVIPALNARGVTDDQVREMQWRTRAASSRFRAATERPQPVSRSPRRGGGPPSRPAVWSVG